MLNYTPFHTYPPTYKIDRWFGYPSQTSTMMYLYAYIERYNTNHYTYEERCAFVAAFCHKVDDKWELWPGISLFKALRELVDEAYGAYVALPEILNDIHSQAHRQRGEIYEAILEVAKQL
jgi:hypothetical protein